MLARRVRRNVPLPHPSCNVERPAVGPVQKAATFGTTTEVELMLKTNVEAI